MLRLTVIVLLAFNLLLAAAWLLGGSDSQPEPVPATGPARGVLPTMVLAAEMEPQAASEAGAPIAAEAPACYSLGPFETAQALDRARDALAPHAGQIVERTTEALMELGYWVELRSFDEFENAAEAVRDLRRKGLEDVAVVTDENGERWVSLGFFLEERNARRRRDQARELGFAAVTRVNRAAQARFWLDYMQAGGTPPASATLAETIPPGLHRSVPCGGALAE